jgi:uncharacterized membrane protein YbhN (UPF0104 family)
MYKIIPLTAGSLSLVLAAMYLCLACAQIPLGLDAALTVAAFISFSSMIPSAPAGVGVLQYACKLALEIYGISASRALAFSLLYQVTHLVPLSLLGAFFLVREGLDLRRLAASSTPEEVLSAEQQLDG